MIWMTPGVRDLGLRCSIMTVRDCWKLIGALANAITNNDWHKSVNMEHKLIHETVMAEPDDVTRKRLMGVAQVHQATYNTAQALGFGEEAAGIIAKIASEHAAVVQFEEQGLSLPVLRSFWPLDDDVNDLEHNDSVIDTSPGKGSIPSGILNSFGVENVDRHSGEGRGRDDDSSDEAEGAS